MSERANDQMVREYRFWLYDGLMAYGWETMRALEIEDERIQQIELDIAKELAKEYLDRLHAMK